MAQPGFGGLLVVVSVAFLAPFLLGLFPMLRLPSVVFEIVAGILIGPSVFGWVEVDQTIEVLALIGLAYLLFLAGLEIDLSSCAAGCCGWPCWAGRSRSGPPPRATG
jgi:Kef-type K+ transport system membrane component KefB